MGDQRSRFRFRLPWSGPSGPALRPAIEARRPYRAPAAENQTNNQPNANPTAPTAAQKPAFRPPGIAQPPPPQAQTPPKTDSPSTTTTQIPTPTTAETQNPPQFIDSTSIPTNQPTAEDQSPSEISTTTSPVIPSQTKEAPAQSSLAEAQGSPNTESQSLSPSLSIPSQTTSQTRARTQSRVTSQPPSTSRVTQKSQATSHPSSPVRPQPKRPSQTVRQPRTSSRSAAQPSGRTSLNPSSPISTTTNEKLTGAANQPHSPSKTANAIESSHPSPTSDEPQIPSPISEKQNHALSQPQSAHAQPQNDIIPSSPKEATTQPAATATQPSEQLGPTTSTPMVAKEIPSPGKISDSTIAGEYPKPLTNSDKNPLQTNSSKEMPEDATAVAYKASAPIPNTEEQPRVSFQAEEKQLEQQETLVYEASGSMADTKEQLEVAFQAEERQLDKQEIIPNKEVMNSNTFKGKQSKDMMISHQKDKSLESEYHEKPIESNGNGISLQKENKNNISKLSQKMAIEHPEHLVEDKPVTVITMAGENRGATMQLGSKSTKREEAVHIHRGYKLNPDESAEATTDEEESTTRSRDLKNTKQDQETTEYINSNVQGINNSILLNSYMTERNPGVQLTVTRNLVAPIKLNDRTDSLEARDAETNVTHSQKLTYTPTIRRRCLRGLFMEPSDSDPENQEKPRRHGCRFSCGDKKKDNETDVH